MSQSTPNYAVFTPHVIRRGIVRLCRMKSAKTPTKRQILFIHSAGPQGLREGSDELVRYLRKELDAEFDIVSPLMPEPEHPDYDQWIALLDDELAEMQEHVVAIGHSLGGSVLLKYLTEESYDKQFDGLFLIAAPFWGLPDWDVQEYKLNVNFAARLPSLSPIFVYHSSDDHVVPFHHAELYKVTLPTVSFRPLRNRGHLFSAGLPEIVDDIKKLFL